MTSTSTTTATKSQLRINAALLAENEGLVARFASNPKYRDAGKVTLYGAQIHAFEESYHSKRGVTRVLLHLAIGRDGTEELLKADMAVRARQLAQREDNAAIGYRASDDPQIIVGYYKELWTTMNRIRNTWYEDVNDRPIWDNRGTNGLEITLPEREGEKFYILADRCKNHLQLMRRMTGEEYDQLTPAIPSADALGDVETVQIAEF